MGRTLLSAAVAVGFEFEVGFEVGLGLKLVLKLQLGLPLRLGLKLLKKFKVKGGGQECPPHTTLCGRERPRSCGSPTKVSVSPADTLSRPCYRPSMIRHFAVFLLLFSFSVPGQAKEKYQHAGPIHLDRDGEKWAEKTLRKLSLEEKVGQLFMIWVRADFLNLDSPTYLHLLDEMHKYHIGSFAMTVRWDPPFLYRSEPYEAAELLNRLQEQSKLPLLVAADFERGVTMRLRGATVFPHAMAFGAAGKTDYAEAFGRITAQESRAVGVDWNFFPDADVNSNPANPIINTRSFGEDPQQVGDMVAAYIRGSRAYGMMTTAKHFPGHGDTATDSHLSVAQVTGDRARLNSVELRAFPQSHRGWSRFDHGRPRNRSGSGTGPQPGGYNLAGHRYRSAQSTSLDFKGSW